MPSRIHGLKWSALALGTLAALYGAACGNIAFTVANVPTWFGDYERIAGQAYGADERHRLDVYRPTSAEARPLVVFFYGGSWQRGARSDYRFAGAALAQAGYVAVVPDYRLYPQVRFPQFVQDGAAAVAWAIRHAASIGADPSQIFIAGHSAGAHTAALLALDRRYLQREGIDPSVVRGLIGISGPHVLTPDTLLLHDIFAAPYEAKDYRPIEFVSPAAPPALLIHGTDDTVVVPRHSEQLASALRAARVPTELHLLAGKSHADPMAAMSRPARARAPTLALMRQFIDAQIDRSPRPTRE